MTKVSLHPQYQSMDPIWRQMRDTSSGENAVKDGTTLYLPKTEGQKTDKVNGEDAYASYLKRSAWYDYLKNTQQDSIGMLHRESPAIDLAPQLQNWENAATDDGDGIEMLMRRMNEHQLVTGRCGLLLDITDNSDLPVSTLHSGERILNWDSTSPQPRWVILDESEFVIDIQSMNYKWEKKYRLLALDEQGFYYTIRFTEWSPVLLAGGGENDYPLYMGRKYNRIPLSFCNASTIMSDVEAPPLLSLSNTCLSIYRGEADYRQSLYLQAFAVLFLKGFSPDELGAIRVGAGNYIHTQGDNAEASFLEVAGAGLSEMRESQQNLKSHAQDQGVELRDQSVSESGKALSTRLTIRTASLETIANTAANAINQQLEYLHEWTGISGESRIVANTDFVESNQTASELNEMHTALNEGAITELDFWLWLRSNDFTGLPYEVWKSERETTTTTTTTEE